MKLDTIKVYKGRTEVIINKTDLEKWNSEGWVTSAQRKSKGKNKSSEEQEE